MGQEPVLTKAKSLSFGKALGFSVDSEHESSTAHPSQPWSAQELPSCSSGQLGLQDFGGDLSRVLYQADSLSRETGPVARLCFERFISRNELSGGPVSRSETCSIPGSLGRGDAVAIDKSPSFHRDRPLLLLWLFLWVKWDTPT